jgi:hypothetical protein
MSRDILVVTVELDGPNDSRVEITRNAALMAVRNALNELDAETGDVNISVGLVTKDDLTKRIEARQAYVAQANGSPS